MATIDKIDKSKLSGKTLDFYEKLEKQYKADKDLGEKIAKQFYDRLVSNNHPSVVKKKAPTKQKPPAKKVAIAKAPAKKTPAKKAAPKKVATKTTTKRGKSGWQKEVKKIQADLGITYKEATRVYKARRKDTKGKSESISALISRFKKDFGAVKPNKTRNLDQDSKIPAKTAVKRKSPTYGKKGGAKQEHYYEYRMNRRDNSKKPAYLKDGGNVDSFNYKLLDRLQQDAEYAIRTQSLRNLYFVDDYKEHIKEMRKLYNDLKVKPEWLSKSDIDDLEKKLKNIPLEMDKSKKISHNRELDSKKGINNVNRTIKGTTYSFANVRDSQKDAENAKNILEQYGNKATILTEDGIVGLYWKNTMAKGGNLQKNSGDYLFFKEKGGKIGFEALSDKVAKNYEGKKVPLKFQDEYGKKYDKEEAKEVGDKVAAKVYRQQQAKMEKGGVIKKGAVFISPEGHKIKFNSVNDKSKKANASFMFSFDKKYEKGGSDSISNWEKLLKKDKFKPLETKMEFGGEPRHKKPYIATILMKKGGEIAEDELMEHYNFYVEDEEENGNEPLSYDEWYREYGRYYADGGRLAKGGKVDGKFSKPEYKKDIYDGEFDFEEEGYIIKNTFRPNEKATLRTKEQADNFLKLASKIKTLDEYDKFTDDIANQRIKLEKGGQITLTPEAIMLEDGFVYHKLSNGDYTDGDNLFKAEIFDDEKMGADIDGDGDLYSYSKYDETHPNFDKDRYTEGQEFIKELIANNELPNQFKKGGKIDFFDKEHEKKWNNSSIEEREKILSKTSFSDKYKYFDYKDLTTSIKEKLIFAKGGKINSVEISNFKNDFGRDITFDMKVPSMAKAENFLLLYYPIPGMEKFHGIQSSKKFGVLSLRDGSGILSKGKGNELADLRRDMMIGKALTFELSKSQLKELNSEIRKAEKKADDIDTSWWKNSDSVGFEKGGKVYNIPTKDFTLNEKVRYKRPRASKYKIPDYVEVKIIEIGKGKYPAIELNNGHTARWNGKEYQLEDMAYTVLEKYSNGGKIGYRE